MRSVVYHADYGSLTGEATCVGVRGGSAIPRASAALQRTSREPEFLQRLPYARNAHLLTGDHRTLFAALNAAAPDDLAVLPDVRLADILHVEPHTTQPERYQERIREGVIDFVLCSAGY